MSAETLSILQGIAGVGSFIIPCYQLIFNTHNKWYKRITPIGYCLLFFSFYLAWVWWEGRKVGKATEAQAKEELKQEIKNALKEYQLSLKDSAGKTIVVIDSTNYYGIPNVGLLNQSDFEAYYNKSNDTIWYKIKLWNTSKVDAYNFKLNLHVAGSSGGKLYDCTIIYPLDEKSTFVAGYGFTYEPATIVFNMPRFDSVFLYLKGTYTNFFKTVKKELSECVYWDFNLIKGAIPPTNRKKEIASFLKIKY